MRLDISIFLTLLYFIELIYGYDLFAFEYNKTNYVEIDFREDKNNKHFGVSWVPIDLFPSILDTMKQHKLIDLSHLPTNVKLPPIWDPTKLNSDHGRRRLPKKSKGAGVDFRTMTWNLCTSCTKAEAPSEEVPYEKRNLGQRLCFKESQENQCIPKIRETLTEAIATLDYDFMVLTQPVYESTLFQQNFCVSDIKINGEGGATYTTTLDEREYQVKYAQTGYVKQKLPLNIEQNGEIFDDSWQKLLFCGQQKTKDGSGNDRTNDKVLSMYYDKTKFTIDEAYHGYVISKHPKASKEPPVSLFILSKFTTVAKPFQSVIVVGIESGPVLQHEQSTAIWQWITTKFPRQVFRVILAGDVLLDPTDYYVESKDGKLKTCDSSFLNGMIRKNTDSATNPLTCCNPHLIGNRDKNEADTWKTHGGKDGGKSYSVNLHGARTVTTNGRATTEDTVKFFYRPGDIVACGDWSGSSWTPIPIAYDAYPQHVEYPSVVEGKEHEDIFKTTSLLKTASEGSTHLPVGGTCTFNL